MKTLLKYLALYAFVFNPILAGYNIGLVKFLYPFLLLYLILGKLSKGLKETKGTRSLYFILILYVFIRTLFGGESVFLYVHIITFIEILILPFFILVLFEKEGIIKPLAIVGSIAAVISLLCFIIPSFKTIIDGLQQAEEELELFAFRGFGFAEGRTFYYSLSLALILSLGLMNWREFKYIYIFIPAFLVAIAFNARTGILILIVGLIMTLLKSRFWFHPKVILTSFALVLVLFFVLQRVIDVSSESFRFAYDAFLQMNDFLFGTDTAESDTFGALKQAVILPNSLSSWLFGDGYSLIREVKNADTGYNNQLIYGGLVYMFLLYMVFLKQWINSFNKKDIYVYFFIFLIVFLANFKGNLMSSNGTYRTIMLLLFYFQMKNNHRTTAESIS